MFPSAARPTFGIFVKEQVEDLRRLGVHVDVLAFDGSVNRREYVRAAVRLQRLVDRSGADLVHAHYGLTGAVALVQRRLPVVTTFHGSDASGHVPWQRWVSWVVARLSTPVFVSAPLASGLGLPRAPVIPAAVDVDRFAPMSRLEARRRLGWSDEGVYVLLPGSRAVPSKRPDLFDATLAVARLEMPEIEGVSLEDLSRDEVSLTMNAVDAVLMTSSYEGSPVAVKEALACATPVVSVPVADVPELIRGLPGCEVAPRVPEELARALVGAIGAGRSPELRERVIPFSRQQMALELQQVYRSVIERGCEK